MPPRITQVASRVSQDGQVQLVLALSDGRQVQVQMTTDEFSDLIGQLIEARGNIQMRQLVAEVPLTDPIHVQAIGIEPLPGSSTDAVLTIASGALRLQFALPISDLLAALEYLKRDTEPDPNSPHSH